MNQFISLPADMIREIAMQCNYADFFALYNTSKYIQHVINPHTIERFMDKYTSYYDGYKIINVDNKLRCVNDMVEVWCSRGEEYANMKRNVENQCGSLSIVIIGNYISVCCLYDNRGRYIGILDRANGPAFIKNGEYRWYSYGVPHNTNGPAVITKNIKKWYRYGDLHRIGGPAVEHADGIVEYWINGVPFDNSEFKK